MSVCRLVGSIVQRSSDDRVLQVPDENRRLGVDAVVHNACTQLKKFAPGLHRLGQLRVDNHGEPGPDSELRTKIVLLESRKSTERARLDSYDRCE